MQQELEKLAIDHGNRVKVIAIEHLMEMKQIIDEFKNQEELNDFQKWIINDLYQFEIPELDFKIQSILLVAVHHPFYAKVTFEQAGKRNTFLSLTRPDFKGTESYLREIVEKHGYSMVQTGELPFKRLGAHSGLAAYGRNNITYNEEFGSNFSYAAYFTDIPCTNDTWGEIKNVPFCDKCNLCMENCPTGAIRNDRFLLNNQRCLSCINEGPGEFPDWLPASVHHTLYDCLICQRVCPLNHKELDYVLDNIDFTEEETAILLEGKPMDALPKKLKEKVFSLGLDWCYDAVPRNLKALFNTVE
jgi:epoxyqueuosine reductase